MKFHIFNLKKVEICEITLYIYIIIQLNSGYIKYRKFCGLTVPSNWAEKPKEIRQENWDNLKLVYNKVEDIDAFTGGVSEDSISDGVVGKGQPQLKKSQKFQLLAEIF